MDFNHLRCNTENFITYICIDKAKTMNALDGDLLKELSTAFMNYQEDLNTRVIIILSSAKKYFISGGDIEHISSFESPVAAKCHIADVQHTFNLIENLNKPVIAAISGLALGGGCELAMSCHIRIASETAKFGQPEIKIGLIPGAGGTQRLARLCGKGIAAELVLTGDIIDADRALRIGLVNHVVPEDALIQEAERIGKRIVSNAPIAVRFAMEAINRSGDSNLEDGLNMEKDLFALLCSTADMREGVAAFKEKRKPTFVGK
jgi:enoyl-CoA hydratase